MNVLSEDYITERIPHRPPFLWLDRVVEISESSILAEKTIPEDLDLFQGHYPGYPLVPGVLLCEAAMQAGAVLLALRGDLAGGEAVPVATRLSDVKFKQMVRPGEMIRIEVTLNERLADAFFMSAKVTAGATTSMSGLLSVPVSAEVTTGSAGAASGSTTSSSSTLGE